MRAGPFGKDQEYYKATNVVLAGPSCTMTNHNENIYRDPQVFRPKRWLEQPNDMMKHYMPFLVGRRNCVAQRLAMAELYTVLSALVRKLRSKIIIGVQFKFFTTEAGRVPSSSDALCVTHHMVAVARKNPALCFGHFVDWITQWES